MLARILEHDSLRTTSELAEIRAALAAKQPIWIDLERQSADADALLAELHLHPLTIEDIWGESTFPKLDEFAHYLYVIVHGVGATDDGTFKLAELDVVIGDGFVLTHDPSGIISNEVAAELAHAPRPLAKGPAWVAHAVLDHAVDRYLPVIDDLDARLALLEAEVLRDAGTRRGPPVLRRILRFKRMLQGLRRISIHQREILLRLARGEFDEIPAEAVPFYRDVYDHVLRINDLVDGYRDLVAGALEAYLSVQSNRMNEIMKTLTLISTVMLPLTFIVGIYGMNFRYMPELTWRWGYVYALALMAATVLGALWWFWHKGWIGWRELDVPED